ncbi:MAG: mechanosensitive ion channel family protein [ANME-2 cluster archaeon]|nr:mechanosensitive ion channel family protein [ANME-2 cluster archaeon]MBC2700732.1 mechanosensitive ion channel family protein [ANME-2 cluster archaeon]MBC2709054.1 mechanosensitive ion channel family protein [ANME-2 cluster archaeon]MBC2747313.1 mechanosensitive ion channel family protein [ANME-2 cluster archaeon]MBC2764079.1 mechanosensitive ion channel family protein [ANME-2 cluster archaeon]
MIFDTVIYGNFTVLDRVIYGNVTGFDLLKIIVFLIIAVLIARVVVIYLRRSLKDRMSRDLMEIVIKVTYYTIIVIAVLFSLKDLQIDLSGLLVAGGIIGIVIGFATQSIVGNLVSGLFLMFERPIKIGDQVDIDGTSGFVEDIHTVSTIIRTYEGLYVRIPNEKVFTNKITNYVANTARRFEYVVGIRYSDDADDAIEIIEDLIEEHPIALKDPSPTVFVDNLGDNAVNIIVRIWAPPTEWYDLKMEMLWKIKKDLEENGIEIAFPQRTVWFANELQKQEVS